MYELKAFAHIGPFVDNARGVVAPVGELSPMSFTYTREKEYFNSAAAAGQTLVVFSSKRDGVVETTDGVLATKILAVSKWTYDTAAAGGFTSNNESFRSKFITQFGNLYSLYSTGTMVRNGNNVFVPAVIEFRDKANDNLRYRLWFADEAFAQQFDEYEIKCISPIDDIDVFFQGGAAVDSALKARTPDMTDELRQAAKDGYPETYIRNEPFEWNDPQGILERKPVYWPLIIYGIAGWNIDAIKEALREHILANSTHTKEEWAEIFPEIFTATEFICVPLWGFPSVPNKALTTGLLSSITNVKKGMEQLVRLTRGEGYTEEWMAEHGEMVATTHRCGNMMVIGGPKNRDDVFELYQRYPDYIAVRSTEVDAGRMSPETRRFVIALEEMMIVAEDMKPDSSIPVKFSRMVRDGVLFLVSTVDKFQFLIVSQYSYNDASIGQASDAGEPQLP